MFAIRSWNMSKRKKIFIIVSVIVLLLVGALSFLFLHDWRAYRRFLCGECLWQYGDCLWALKDIHSERVVVRYNIPREYAEAIMRISEASLDGFKEHYDMDILDYAMGRKIYVIAVWDKHFSYSTSADGIIWLRYSCEDDFIPKGKPKGQYYHVYGIAHELSHNTLLLNEPDGLLSEGVAHHLATLIIPHIYDKLGESAWPLSYNYLKGEGIRTYDLRKDQPWFLPTNQKSLMLKIMDAVEKKHGPLILGRAIKNTRRDFTPKCQCWAYPVYGINDFFSTILNLTRDDSIKNLIKESNFSAESE